METGKEQNQMQSPSPWLTLARAVFAVIGIGLVIMVVSNLASGQSLADPVMPAGLALGATMLGAAAWVGASDRIRSAVVWLGIGAAAVAIGVAAFTASGTPSADVIALVAVPSLVVIAAERAWPLRRWLRLPHAAPADLQGEPRHDIASASERAPRRMGRKSGSQGCEGKGRARPYLSPGEHWRAE